MLALIAAGIGGLAAPFVCNLAQGSSFDRSHDARIAAIVAAVKPERPFAAQGGRGWALENLL